jgi:hypothetical protein
MSENEECVICLSAVQERTASSNVCQHYDKICLACKRNMYRGLKYDCPYCKTDWTEQYKKEFLAETVIKAFKETLDTVYLCLTDEEAEEKCREEIKNRLYQMEYEFISRYFKEGCHMPITVYTRLTTFLHEDANFILEPFITSLEEVCKAFIEQYGRGALLAEDDLEIPVTIYNHKLFLYSLG